MKPLLMMRTRSLQGPLFTKVKGGNKSGNAKLTHLAKSVGNYYAAGAPGNPPPP